MSRRWMLFWWMAGAVLPLGFAGAQLSGTADAAGTRPAPQFHANASMVLVPVAVADRRGMPVLGLNRTDFRLWDNGRPAEIAAVSRWEEPVSSAIVLDASGSMYGTFPRAKSIVTAFLDRAEAPDETCLISFADKPRLEAGLTSDPQALLERLLWLKPSNWTALYDGIDRGIEQLQRAAQHPRRVLLVVSDGGDNHSRLTAGQLRTRLLETHGQLFAVLVRRNVRDRNEQRGRLALDDMASQTGGQAILVDSDEQVPEAVAHIAELIHNEYLLTYRPAEAAGGADGAWRRVKVDVRPEARRPQRLRVSAKSGYHAP